LKKKEHIAISYHLSREAPAAANIRIAKEPTETDLADGLTKDMPGLRPKFIFGHLLTLVIR
jgi:hypothetical protein